MVLLHSLPVLYNHRDPSFVVARQLAVPWTGDKLELFAKPLAFVVLQTTAVAMEGGKSQGRLVRHGGFWIRLSTCSRRFQPQRRNTGLVTHGGMPAQPPHEHRPLNKGLG